MACPKWSLFIAGLLIVGYSCAIFYTLESWDEVFESDDESPDPSDKKSEENTDVDTDDAPLKHFIRDEIVQYTFLLVTYIGCLIASVFMFVGLIKGRHKFIAPWLIICLIDLIGESVIMYYESKLETAAYMGMILALAIIWYPIYRQYKLIRYQKRINSTNAPNTQMCYIPTTEYVHRTTPAPVVV